MKDGILVSSQFWLTCSMRKIVRLFVVPTRLTPNAIYGLFLPTYVYNTTNIIHSYNSSITPFRFLDPISMYVGGGSSYTYLYQAILDHQQVNFDAICPETAPDSQVKGSVLQDCPPPLTPYSGCNLCFWSTSYRLEVPTTSPLGSINLLEQLTELRKTLTFTNSVKKRIP